MRGCVEEHRSGNSEIVHAPLTQSAQNVRGWEFVPLKDAGKVAHGSGLYAFYDNERLLYIGSALCVHARIDNHLLRRQFKGMEVFVGWFPMESEFLLRSWEKRLIKMTRPLFNIMHQPKPGPKVNGKEGKR